MIAEELARLVLQGMRPVITFERDIALQQTCFDPGMRGRVVGCFDNGSPYRRAFRFQIDLRQFENYNSTFEARTHQDRFGIPRLTSREAKCYSAIDSAWVDADCSPPWTIEESDKVALVMRYRQENSAVSYVQWLEDKVMEMEQALRAASKDLLTCAGHQRGGTSRANTPPVNAARTGSTRISRAIQANEHA